MTTHPVTTDTITDAHVEELLDACDVTLRPDDQSIVDDCYLATSTVRLRARRAARARLAALWNERHAADPATGPTEISDEEIRQLWRDKHISAETRNLAIRTYRAKAGETQRKEARAYCTRLRNNLRNEIPTTP